MGTIRTLLAIAVVLSHTGSNYAFVDSSIAVEMFYVASGFLISFALTSNANYRSNLRSFYFNRALRLYPIYFVVLAIASLGFLVFPSFLGPPLLVNAHISNNLKVFLTFSNFALIGQDWCYLMGLDAGNLVFMPKFWMSVPVLWSFFPVPQAWTLGVEVTFYLLAPFILLHKRTLALTFIVTAAFKVFFLSSYGGVDPWYYRVFPIELSLFLLGAISQQFISPGYRAVTTSFPGCDIGISVMAIVVVLLFGVMPVDFSAIAPAWNGVGCCLVFALALPALFAFQRRFTLDRAIGELSYPIYIVHFLGISFGGYIMGRYGVQHVQVNAMFVTGLSIVAAGGLNFFVARPVEKMRNRVRSGSDRTETIAVPSPAHH
jgi:peptidoglycan/LPS O-acetylase OafA/YrhL